jgi:aminoglycoside 6'-N-acetyltransferase I
MSVEVIGPRIEDKPLIKNLFTFYRYDMMPLVEQGPGAWVNQFGTIDGESSKTHEEAVAGNDRDWAEPGKIIPLLIRWDERPAGLIYVTAPPYAHRSVNWRFNELFVLNKCRRHGVATQAVLAVLGRFRGKWEVAYLPKNLAAAAFWHKLVPQYTGGHYTEGLVDMGPNEPSLPGFFFDNTRTS